MALLDAQMAGLGLGPAVGGVRLLVPAWDEARALELLAPPPWSPEPAPTPAASGAGPRPASEEPANPPPAATMAGRRALAPLAWLLLGLAAAAGAAWALRGPPR